MRIMVTSFKTSHACTGGTTLGAPNPASRHHQPTPPLETLATPRQVWVSLLWGHCSFLQRLGAHKVLCALQESISQSCVSSGSSMVGLMSTSSKRAYAISRSAAPRAPVTVAVHCSPVSPEEMLKHSSVSVSVGSLGPRAHRIRLSPLSIFMGMVFDSKCEFTSPSIFLGLLLCPWMWGISPQWLQHCAATTPAPTILLGFLWPWTWGISS